MSKATTDLIAKMPQPLYSFYIHNSLPRQAHDIDCGTEMITKQSMAAECDINNILKQYSRTGIIEHINEQNQQWLDLPSSMDYQQSLNTLIEADNAFASLPAMVRDHFHNNPNELLMALSDPAQADKLREFGILKPLPDVPLATSPAPAAPKASD